MNVIAYDPNAMLPLALAALVIVILTNLVALIGPTRIRSNARRAILQMPVRIATFEATPYFDDEVRRWRDPVTHRFVKHP